MRVDYDELWQRHWSTLQSVGPLTRSRYRLILRALKMAMPHGARVLDVGCGNGTLLALLARQRPDLSLHGIEQSTAAIASAPAGIRANITQGSIESALPAFEADPVDALICSEVLEHLDAPEAALRGMRRALKPGATAVFTVPARMSWWSSQDEFAGHVRRFEHAQFARMLRDTGFLPCGQYGWGVGPALLYDRLTSWIGPSRTIRAGGTPVGRWVARLLYTCFLVEDLLPSALGIQLVAIARSGEPGCADRVSAPPSRTRTPRS